jgi:hypothetical protein
MPTSIGQDDLIAFMHQISVRLLALETLANKHFPNDFRDCMETSKQSFPSPDLPDFLNAIRGIGAGRI